MSIRPDIHTVITVIDEHDAGIMDGVYICPCGYRGSEQDWEVHVAQVIDERLAVQLELPAAVSV